MSWQKFGAVIAMSLAVAACGGTTIFEGKVALAVQGTPPPPPPPPKEDPKRVEQQGDKIIIREKVQFDVNRASIRPESHDLLKEVAEVIKAKTDIVKLRVDGHASQDGPAQHNMVLSQRRARAVMEFLAAQGVSKARLSSKGFGETTPLGGEPENNRRVEFTILEQK